MNRQRIYWNYYFKIDKNMKKIMIILFIAIMFIKAGCSYLVESVYCIKIQNYSNDTIRFYDSYTYPDTLINKDKPRLKWVIPQTHSPLQSKKDFDKVLVSPNDTMNIFFFSEKALNTYDWNKIVNDYLILKRYDLSLSDLQNLKFEVTYPT
jgi:hypothetical protein